VSQTAAPAASARALLEEFLRILGRSVRAHQLYEGKNPVLERFGEALARSLSSVWSSEEEVTLRIEESRIIWDGEAVYAEPAGQENLAFAFFKDGVRQLTLLPGFEEEELTSFVGVLARIHRVKQDEDDLITLLWESDFSFLQYRYIDTLAEGVELPAESGAAPASVDAQGVREEAAGVVSTVTKDDFQEALYFLEEGELRRLAEEVALEMRRDLWQDVLNALLDQMEVGPDDIKLRAVRVLRDLLPALLGAASLERAARVLEEIAGIGAKNPPPPPAVLGEMRQVFAMIASPEAVDQLVLTLEDAPEAMRGDALTRLIRYFPPESLPVLIRATASTGRSDVREALGQGIRALAPGREEIFTGLLGDDDPLMIEGAIRWTATLKLEAAAPRLAGLLSHPAAPVRLAAVEAMQELRTSVGAGALVQALDDPDRGVRIAAARALGHLRYSPARPQVEAAIGSRRIRETDITERIAFFEAFGLLAGAEGIPLLVKILNGKSLLGRREPPEMRACAALALARIPDPRARSALAAAAADAEPVVRSAVARAMRGGSVPE
jgi:HEAT repeat protein